MCVCCVCVQVNSTCWCYAGVEAGLIRVQPKRGVASQVPVWLTNVTLRAAVTWLHPRSTSASPTWLMEASAPEAAPPSLHPLNCSPTITVQRLAWARGFDVTQQSTWWFESFCPSAKMKSKISRSVSGAMSHVSALVWNCHSTAYNR